MADKNYNKNKTKETTDPNFNDLKIKDNSTIDNLIPIMGIGHKNSNLENNDEFNLPLEILANDNTEAQTRNNCEYLTSDLLDTFYNDHIDLKHYINGILNILNKRNTTSTKQSSHTKQILLLEELVRILKLEN